MLAPRPLAVWTLTSGRSFRRFSMSFLILTLKAKIRILPLACRATSSMVEVLPVPARASTMMLSPEEAEERMASCSGVRFMDVPFLVVLTELFHVSNVLATDMAYKGSVEFHG